MMDVPTRAEPRAAKFVGPQNRPSQTAEGFPVTTGPSSISDGPRRGGVRVSRTTDARNPSRIDDTVSHVKGASYDRAGRRHVSGASPVEDATPTPAKPSAPPSARGDGWRDSSYRRPASGARRAPAGDGGAFFDDDLADIGR